MQRVTTQQPTFYTEANFCVESGREDNWSTCAVVPAILSADEKEAQMKKSVFYVNPDLKVNQLVSAIATERPIDSNNRKRTIESTLIVEADCENNWSTCVIVPEKQSIDTSKKRKYCYENRDSVQPGAQNTVRVCKGGQTMQNIVHGAEVDYDDDACSTCAVAPEKQSIDAGKKRNHDDGNQNSVQSSVQKYVKVCGNKQTVIKQPGKNNVSCTINIKPILPKQTGTDYTSISYLFKRNDNATRHKIVQEFNNIYQKDTCGYVYYAFDEDDEYNDEDGNKFYYEGSIKIGTSKNDTGKIYTSDDYTRVRCVRQNGYVYTHETVFAVSNYKKVGRLVVLLLHHMKVNKCQNGKNQHKWFNLESIYINEEWLGRFIRKLDIEVEKQKDRLTITKDIENMI